MYSLICGYANNNFFSLVSQEPVNSSFTQPVKNSALKIVAFASEILVLQ